MSHLQCQHGNQTAQQDFERHVLFFHFPFDNHLQLFSYVIILRALISVEFFPAKKALTSKSNVAGSFSALNLARDPKVSGADQCLACDNGFPRTSKL